MSAQVCAKQENAADNRNAFPYHSATQRWKAGKTRKKSHLPVKYERTPQLLNGRLSCHKYLSFCERTLRFAVYLAGSRPGALLEALNKLDPNASISGSAIAVNNNQQVLPPACFGRHRLLKGTVTHGLP